MNQPALDVDVLEMLLEEATVDPSVRALLARDELGWRRIDTFDDELISRDALIVEARRARVMSIADPLIRRAVNLRVTYVWSQGCTITAAQEEGAEQDVNAVVQGFLDDPSNLESFSSQQACEEFERTLATDGNAFHALITDPLFGRIQVRTIPFREMTDKVTNPEDARETWFFKRTYVANVVEAGYAPGSTRIRRESRTVYYPALGYRPAQRPKTLDGKPIEWDKPVLHTSVNRVSGSKWGAPDLLAALPWALGYKEFLEDWAKLVKALSRLAFKATARGRNSAQVRTALNAAPTDGTSAVGGTVVMGEGQSIEAIGKSGATIDSGSGRPLAAMVASATDVPVTMLLADPGVTGARATAETLDQPLQLWAGDRRELHGSMRRTVLDYVIDQAVKAPRGSLRGTVRIDPVTRREVITLTGDQPRAVTVDWPSLDKTPLVDLVRAIAEADGTGKLPPLVIARMLLLALDVDDVDAVLEQLVDGQGNFVYPDDAAAARSQQDAVARGDLPGTPAADQQPANDPGQPPGQ